MESLILIIFGCLLSPSLSQEVTVQDTIPSTPLWGGTEQFTVSVNMTNPADSSTNPEWRFDYLYDSTNEAELYQHHAGNGDEVCGNIAKFEVGAECNILNAADGNTYATNLETGKCCRVLMHLGMVKSDWLRTIEATYNGTATINGYDADQWFAEGAYTNNYACTQDDKQNPVAFWEHKGEKLKRWDFLLETFVKGEPEQQKFEIPDGCSKICE
ncbi:hypothetical protein ScalyP_jg6905 [Parmales sp. scaly parma]|nr:hypothetical protein ScalyP_jg6905 [Parmales sp. scaly parma]